MEVGCIHPKSDTEAQLHQRCSARPRVREDKLSDGGQSDQCS